METKRCAADKLHVSPATRFLTSNFGSLLQCRDGEPPSGCCEADEDSAGSVGGTGRPGTYGRRHTTTVPACWMRRARAPLNHSNEAALARGSHVAPVSWLAQRDARGGRAPQAQLLGGPAPEGGARVGHSKGDAAGFSQTSCTTPQHAAEGQALVAGLGATLAGGKGAPQQQAPPDRAGPKGPGRARSPGPVAARPARLVAPRASFSDP